MSWPGYDTYEVPVRTDRLGEKIPDGTIVFRNKRKKRGEAVRALALEKQGNTGWVGEGKNGYSCCYHRGEWRRVLTYHEKTVRGLILTVTTAWNSCF